MKDFQLHLLLYFVILVYELLHDQELLNFIIQYFNTDRFISDDLPANGRAIPNKKAKTVPNILMTIKAATRRSTSIAIGRSFKRVFKEVF